MKYEKTQVLSFHTYNNGLFFSFSEVRDISEKESKAQEIEPIAAKSNGSGSL